jgi:hypothetical protein
VPVLQKPKLILDLCGGTGAWSRPYKQAVSRATGENLYRVGLITLPDYDVTKTFVDYNKRRLVFRKETYPCRYVTVPFSRVYGILAAPPCTEFSFANKGRFNGLVRPNWQEGLATVEACERIIRACMTEGTLKFWALENPVGHLRKFLGRPQLTFEHWWYDENAWVSKKTDLWGYFNNPKRLVFEKPEHVRVVPGNRDESHWFKNNQRWYTPVCPPEYAHLNLDRAAIRAITPKGFAEAFFAANK